MLNFIDAKLVSILQRVSSPTKGPYLFINDTTDLFPENDFDVSPKAKYFPNIIFLPDQVNKELATLESIRLDFHE